MSIKLEQLNQELRNKFMPIKSLKIYSNSYSINDKISFISSLDKGIRGVCSQILDFFEARVNTDSAQKNYMIVYASQQEIADLLGYSREYISHCINRMAENENCPFQKIRQGLNKANYYILQKKKEMIELLKEIFIEQQKERDSKNKEKQEKNKNNWKKSYSKKENNWNYEGQRKYNFQELEKKLLGWE